MGFEDLVIIKGLEQIMGWINDNIENPILRGLAFLLFMIVLLWFLGYFIVYGLIQKHFVRFFIIMGVWVVLEIANFIGGGHEKR